MHVIKFESLYRCVAIVPFRYGAIVHCMNWKKTYPVTGICQYLFSEHSEESELCSIESQLLQCAKELDILMQHGKSTKSSLVDLSITSSIELNGQALQVDVL